MGEGRQKLSERAKARLAAALALIRHDPAAFGLPKSWKLDDRCGYYESILAVIEALGSGEQERLKVLVDWIEDYQRGDQDPAF
jgi:hypothetical protein